MEKKELKDILPEAKELMLEALSDAQKAFLDLDSNKLKNISDYTMHYAGIFQDSFSISIAIIVYSLAKLVDLRKVREYNQWEHFKNNIVNYINAAALALENDDTKAYLHNIKKILAEIGRLEAKFGEFVTEVIKRARIKKSSSVYKHGLSVGRAAQLMGVSPWELMDYLGQTKYVDEMPMVSKAPAERMKEARRVFNLE